MPNTRAASPPPQAAEWLRADNRPYGRVSASDPSAKSGRPTIAQRRQITAAPSRLLTRRTSSQVSSDDRKREEEEDEEHKGRFSLSSPVTSLQSPSPDSPTGLLLFRRRSSTNLATAGDARVSDSLPLLPNDYASSRRPSDGTSSALSPAYSTGTSRRGSWSTIAAEEERSVRGRNSALFLHAPSATSARSNPSASRYGGTSSLSPIEASPLIPFSADSTPYASPTSSAEILARSTFSSSCSSDRTPEIEPFLPSQVDQQRRVSYSVIELDPRHAFAQASEGPFLPAPIPVSARSIRRQLRRILVASISVFILLAFIRPSHLELVRTYADFDYLATLERYDLGRLLSKPQNFDIANGNGTSLDRMTPHPEETRQVAGLSTKNGGEESQQFRQEQLWAPTAVKLKTRTIEPKEGFPHEATLIMLHGLSQTVEHNSFLHSELGSKLPSVRWVMPQAPKLPITYHKQELRPAWFDISVFPWNGVDDSDEEQYFSSARAINMVIAEERDRLLTSERNRRGKPLASPVTREEQEWASKRILIGGFSQGGVMSLLTGLTSEHRLGGIVVFSGMLPLRHVLPELVRGLETSDTPVWWGHGEMDPFLLSRDAASSVQALRAPAPGLALSRVTFETYPHLQHTWSREEINDLAAWMARTLDTPLRPVVPTP